MSKKPISLNNISLLVNNKTCFENFSAQIYPKKRIVIMGINGSGKSTLLKIIQGQIDPSEGTVNIPAEITFWQVEQTIKSYPELSGGQRFNKALTYALSLDPDVLCLDEPTNHLDLKNKRSLIRMLQHYDETLIIISHDPEILKLNFDEIWHLEHNKINVFKGNYDDYLKENQLEKDAVEYQRGQAHKEKNKLRKLIEQENKRASQSKSVNRNENDKNLLGAMKQSGSQTVGKNLKRLSKVKEDIQQKLTDSFVHKKIEPKFNIDAYKVSLGKSIVSIVNGSCGYAQNVILNKINLQLKGGNKIAIIGDNGSGKSTLIKALLENPNILTGGEWVMPKKSDIGYLDQHYSTLNPNLTVVEVLQEAMPTWTDLEVRKHLNDFLFFTQEDVSNKVLNLSGGEKARLCLAVIAAKSPSLLLLDEITNNIDLETREYVSEVLKSYPGAAIVVTHDPSFLKSLEIYNVYEIINSQLVWAESII